VNKILFRIIIGITLHKTVTHSILNKNTIMLSIIPFFVQIYSYFSFIAIKSLTAVKIIT
jgi:hypothetical protein